MLCQHQRQTAIGNELGIHGLAQIPDLGQGHFKADGGGAELQTPQHIHGGGVENVQAEITVDPEAQLPGGDQQAQIAHQNIPDTVVSQVGKLVLQLGKLIIVDNAGKNRCDTAPAQQLLQQLHVL